ncbi:MAG: hypothetical protein WD691_01915 [Acidimicrobiales bacterium]
MATSCSRCGDVGDDGSGDAPPLGWSTSTSDGGMSALCVRCTREHVRDIEAKLDEPWWT